MRRTPLKRGTSQLKRSPLKKSGQTKRKKIARQKAFYSSALWKATRKLALVRAGNRCEHTEWYSGDAYHQVPALLMRCTVTTNLQVHHKTNAHFGGDERPEDLQVLCKTHHDLVELRDHPHRQRSR